MNETYSGQGLKAEEGQAVIELKNVSFGYDPSQPVFQNISFTIPQGQWVSLIGANGCGKSTLVKLLNALLPKSDGEINVGGLVLNEENIAAIRQIIGMVFQNPDNQFIGATVEEDIIFGLEGLCLPPAEIGRRLHAYAGELGIAHLLAKHPGELSGGQKQRVAIASILAMEPGIVIFDEASSMLDEGSRNELMEILQRMRAEGKYTIVMISHDADEIMASDRVIALHGGGLAGDMSPAELFRNEKLLEECNLRMPYPWRLARELEKHGIHTGVPAGEKELIDKLWP
ncbi:ATP-binding cassette domain-containing protein [Paenibacillus sp. sgz500958]|uniref:ATP-binding cassette domain-containing protein n=1 Tax=Paenibacillus sp. sgz500958 TaxID=3242475 RepID=UPI0036D2D771